MLVQPYEMMDARQAADALDAYLAERDPALRRLRGALADGGLDPDETLDGSVYSVSPLWAWITARITELGVDPHALADDPTRPGWPSWARHGRLVDPHPPAETIALVDGFASYLGRVIDAAAPDAAGRSGSTSSPTTRCSTIPCSPPTTTRSSCPPSRSTAPTSPLTADPP
ncbi:hypothetical protein [Kocuria sp. CNJ-770]|uniref:hypothetical protein n=1 Tax=Kocuria sp. CNJ-770 TaxID=1904964 RepID=UPI002100877D|nr:hypothetical protein [Kocuria sp. CNJ-770]